MTKRSRSFLCLLFTSGSGLIAMAACHTWITRSTAGNHSDDLESLPFRNFALVPGCAEFLANGRPNLYFRYRIEAAVALYEAGKCRYFIVSGDNGREEYNEPEAMRQALMDRGVPEERILQDFAGFRTLDSVVRARTVFSQDRLIVVSQSFHNERAIFIGRHRGIDLIGYNARDLPATRGAKTKLRELAARVKTVLDLFVTHEEPRFQGPPVDLTRYPVI